MAKMKSLTFNNVRYDVVDADSITSPDTANVGQTIVVKSVDKNNKPIEWKAVDLPQGGGGGGTGGIVEQVQSDWNETDTASPAYIKNKPVISGDGGTSVQANWNQTDETAADFIKNKPFGETDGIIDILPLTTYTNFYLDTDFGMYAYAIFDPIFSLTIGETYTVFWDGVEYECVAQDASYIMDGAVFVGDASLVGLSGNNEPFVIACINGAGVQYFALTDTEEDGYHTVRIAQDGMVVNYLDNKYLDFMSYVKPKNKLLPLTIYENFNFKSDFGVYGYYALKGYDITLDETYIVTWDGIEYECVAQDMSVLMEGAMALGNASAFGMSGNNEPFLIGYTGNMILYASLTDTADGGYHIVGVHQELDGYYMVKDEYIGDTLPIVTNDNNGEILTVVDGAWTAQTPASGLPEVTTDDNGKTLVVSGGEWSVSSALPTVTSSDAGKFLRVSSTGTWIVEALQDVSEVGA